jgi:hypothetical protein
MNSDLKHWLVSVPVGTGTGTNRTVLYRYPVHYLPPVIPVITVP